MPEFKKTLVEEVATKSKQEKWPYPKIFNALKDAGVEYYETDVATHHLVYHGSGDSFTEAPPPNFTPISPAATFDAAAVRQAIQRNQSKQTDYSQFLQEIAAAGVVKYRVDMSARTVSYLGSASEQYVEKVPQF
jgi:uncharacterized protein YbcV (DUF1398 family)